MSEHTDFWSGGTIGGAWNPGRTIAQAHMEILADARGHDETVPDFETEALEEHPNTDEIRQRVAKQAGTEHPKAPKPEPEPERGQKPPDSALSIGLGDDGPEIPDIIPKGPVIWVVAIVVAIYVWGGS